MDAAFWVRTSYDARPEPPVSLPDHASVIGEVSENGAVGVESEATDSVPSTMVQVSGLSFPMVA